MDKIEKVNFSNFPKYVKNIIFSYLNFQELQKLIFLSKKIKYDLENYCKLNTVSIEDPYIFYKLNSKVVFQLLNFFKNPKKLYINSNQIDLTKLSKIFNRSIEKLNLITCDNFLDNENFFINLMNKCKNIEKLTFEFNNFKFINEKVKRNNEFIKDKQSFFIDFFSKIKSLKKFKIKNMHPVFNKNKNNLEDLLFEGFLISNSNIQILRIDNIQVTHKIFKSEILNNKQLKKIRINLTEKSNFSISNNERYYLGLNNETLNFLSKIFTQLEYITIEDRVYSLQKVLNETAVDIVTKNKNLLGNLINNIKAKCYIKKI